MAMGVLGGLASWLGGYLGVWRYSYWGTREFYVMSVGYLKFGIMAMWVLGSLALWHQGYLGVMALWL